MGSTIHRVILASAMALLALASAGCEHRPKDPVISRAEKWFVVTDFRRPKHFYVSFREEGTGYRFDHQYVSKHCNDWRKLQIGSRWKLVEVVRQGKNGNYSELEGVRSVFCQKLREL